MRRWFLLLALGGCDDGASATADPATSDGMVADQGASPDSGAELDLGREADGGAPDMSAPDQGVDASSPDAGEEGVGWLARQALPGAIQEIAVVALRGEVYVIGGFDGAARIVPTVSVYDPEADAWREAAPLPARLHHANAAVVGDRIYLLGFLGGGFAEDGRGFIYDPESDAWTPASPMPADVARGASGVAVIDQTIYFVGGLAGGRAVTNVGAYDTVNDEWTELPPIPDVRDHMVMGAVDGELIVAGGRDGRIGGHTAGTLRWRPGEQEWRRGADMPTSRGGTAGAVLDGKLYVFGGEGAPTDSGVFAQVEVYDPAADRWETLEEMPTPRHGMAAATVGDVIYVPGGATRQAFGAVPTVEAYRPD